MGKTAKKEKKEKPVKKDKKERVKHHHKKDKDAPKRAITAPFFYNKERRPILVKEQPGLSNTEIIKVMSQEYKNLPDAKKKPYIQLAEKDKQRYQKEMEAYRKKNPVKKGKKE
mgnify:CR=1 FL=1